MTKQVTKASKCHIQPEHCPLREAEAKGHGKSSKVREYVKVSRTVPPRSSFDQFRFGQVARSSNSPFDGLSVDSCGTVRQPFLDWRFSMVSVSVTGCVLTSTIWPPLFRHCTMAVNSLLRSTSALMFPTPQSWNSEQVTLPSALQAQDISPDFRCVPDGAQLWAPTKPSKGSKVVATMSVKGFIVVCPSRQ